MRCVHLCWVEGTVTLCDPMWQVTPRSSETTCSGELYRLISNLLQFENSKWLLTIDLGYWFVVIRFYLVFILSVSVRTFLYCLSL